jgi:type IV pilus assembly protein PilE
MHRTPGSLASALARPAALHRRGLTLIELMIAVAVVALLTAIAVPNYQEYLRRAERNNAKAALIRVAQFMERAATANGLYPGDTLVPQTILTVEGGKYAVVLVSTNGATFSATAERKSGTQQANDPCGDFRITETGNRTILNASSGKTAADCWGR